MYVCYFCCVVITVAGIFRCGQPVQTLKTKQMRKFIKNFFKSSKQQCNIPVVSSSCGCVISWGVGFYDVKECKDITHNVTNIFIDRFSSMVEVTIQKGLKVYTVKFTMEHAQEIGFINIKALSNYC